MHTRRSIGVLYANFLYPLSCAFLYGFVSKRLHFCLTANHYCCSLKEQKNENAINGHPSKLFVVSAKYGVRTLNVVYNMLIHIKPKVDTFLITFSPSTPVLFAIQFGLDGCCCTWFVWMIWRIDNAKCSYQRLSSKENSDISFIYHMVISTNLPTSWLNHLKWTLENTK